MIHNLKNFVNESLGSSLNFSAHGGWGKGNIFFGGVFCFAKYEIRKRKRKGSKTRPHSSPDPSCGREESRGGAIPLPQKNSLPRRVQISFQDFLQKVFELRPKNTANFHFL